MNVAFYPDASGRVTINGAPLAPPEAATTQSGPCSMMTSDEPQPWS